MIDGTVPVRGPKTVVRAGARIHYTPPPPEPIDLVAEDIAIDIIHEDTDIVVVNKPKNLVVHPAVGHARGTLVNALMFHVGDFEVADEDVRPGIVHRLDRDTTGLMVVAKNRAARRALVEAFSAREVAKTYLAIAHGVPNPQSAELDTLFGRHPRERKRFSSRVLEGKRAVTRYEVTESFAGASFIEVELETGRTHQIRVHLADIGHPLVGDEVYGRRRKCRDPRVGPIINPFDRPALHAHRLAFAHPSTKQPLEFVSELPVDMQALLDALRATRVAEATQ